MVFCYQIAVWVSGECEVVGRIPSLYLYSTGLLMYTAHHLVKERAREQRSRRGWRRSISASFFEGLLRHPVLTPKTVGAALVEVFAVILPVEARLLLLPLILLLKSEASMVCVTLDVTDATAITAAMATSILWAFISSLARLHRVEEASPGDPRRFLLSSMVPIVTGEIPGPILHCGWCHTLDTRALDDLMCSLPDVARCF